MAAVVGKGDHNVVVKIPKKTITITNNKPAATTTTAAVAAGSSGVAPLFCPIPVKARVVVAAVPSIKTDGKRRESS